ncbi:regulatory helix-turn-helix protein, lysR family [Andreprevotia lacus DSM 23236]|jgi:DNA-binding transcriptional LysR family regulator|uniref:Regulatory helix-turn-helix protein, lysR family n=1 Tax=Andreprevotia lacus DSM 23236 TaxID=1121001 RepID=A0A1W1XKA2_9NEIS|nr:LysR family transcriptional regulator [Andreprevotia lacus]SMC24355.1 regulatory helix-turn-helix protein, lysR family [Andreprevotia lacus DSM 23236]
MAAYVAVAEAQGFTGAARKLGMSAPAVTLAVAARLGVQLL